MSTSAFSSGAIVEISDKSYQLLRKVNDVTWQLEESRTKRIKELTVIELQEAYASSKLRFFGKELVPRARPAPDPATRSPEQWELAKLRRSYVMAVIDVPSTRSRITPLIEQTRKKLGSPIKAPNAATVLRWKRRFLNAGRDISVLIDQDDGKGNRVSRLPPDLTRFVEDAIDSTYLRPERKTLRDTLDIAQALVLRENKLRPIGDQLRPPTMRLVKRVLSRIPAYDQYVARHGRMAATKRFRSVQRHRTTQQPLERAEIDHTQIDLMVVDDVTGMPMGRPWLTLCIDDFTRMILGLCISFDPPSYLTVARCLKHAFLPKTSLRSEYPDVENPWIAYGVMRELVLDNGLEFHSASLENACLSLGIELHYSPRKTPWFKGKVERAIGTTNRAIAHGNPGTTFAGILDKDDYDPSKHAVVKYSTLKKVAMKWVVDVYAQKEHRGLGGIRPVAMWEKSIAVEDIQVPDDPARFDALMGKSETRKLTHKGIELFGFQYNSAELALLRRDLGESLEVEVRIDSSDIGQVVVFSPDKRQLFAVPALNQDYAAGLSEFQHKVCKRFAARENRYDSSGWLEAKLRIAEMIKADSAGKAIRTRSKVARYQGDGEQAATTPADEAAGPIPVEAGKLEPIDPPADEVVHQESVGDSKVTDASETAPVPDSCAAPRKVFKPIFRERPNASVDHDKEGSDA